MSVNKMENYNRSGFSDLPNISIPPLRTYSVENISQIPLDFLDPITIYKLKSEPLNSVLLKSKILDIQKNLLENYKCTKQTPSRSLLVKRDLPFISGQKLEETLKNNNSDALNTRKYISCALEFATGQDTDIRVKFNDWLGNFKIIAEVSTKGNIIEASYPINSFPADLFTIKIPKKITLGNEEDLYDFYNEATVSICGLNFLKAIIPNFNYTYGYTFCNQLQLSPSSMCTLNGPIPYLITENIKPNITFHDFLLNQNVSDYDILNIIVQVLNAIGFANKYLKFTHYDLHTKNVLVSGLNEPLYIPSFGKNTNDPVTQNGEFIPANYRYIKCNFLANIIDFGNSTFEYDGIMLGRTDLTDYNIYRSNSPLADIEKFFMNIIDVIGNDKRQDIKYTLINAMNFFYVAFMSLAINAKILTLNRDDGSMKFIDYKNKNGVIEAVTFPRYIRFQEEIAFAKNEGKVTGISSVMKQLEEKVLDSKIIVEGGGIFGSTEIISYIMARLNITDMLVYRENVPITKSYNYNGNVVFVPTSISPLVTTPKSILLLNSYEMTEYIESLKKLYKNDQENLKSFFRSITLDPTLYIAEIDKIRSMVEKLKAEMDYFGNKLPSIIKNYKRDIRKIQTNGVGDNYFISEKSNVTNIQIGLFEIVKLLLSTKEMVVYSKLHIESLKTLISTVKGQDVLVRLYDDVIVKNNYNKVLDTIHENLPKIKTMLKDTMDAYVNLLKSTPVYKNDPVLMDYATMFLNSIYSL